MPVLRMRERKYVYDFVLGYLFQIGGLVTHPFGNVVCARKNICRMRGITILKIFEKKVLNFPTLPVNSCHVSL